MRHLAVRRTTSLILLVSEREQESPLVLDLPMVETGRLAYAEPASTEASVSCATRTKEGDDEGEEGTHSSPHVGQYALTQSSRRSGLKSMTRARKRYSPSALSASADEIDCCVRPVVSEIEAAGVRHDSSGCVRAKEREGESETHREGLRLRVREPSRRPSSRSDERTRRRRRLRETPSTPYAACFELNVSRE